MIEPLKRLLAPTVVREVFTEACPWLRRDEPRKPILVHRGEHGPAARRGYGATRRYLSLMEADLTNLARQVRESWLEQGLNVNTADLTSVAKSVRDRLAPDFVAFLAVAGLPDEPDALLIEWWEPSKWEVVDCSLLVFAVTLIHSHVYALWLGGTNARKIAVLDGANPRPSIGTTEEFLTAYLADDRVLYG